MGSTSWGYLFWAVYGTGAGNRHAFVGEHYSINEYKAVVVVQREHRLTRREDFNKVYRYGKSSANHQFVVYSLNRPAHVCEEEGYRLGISASKKVGNAVVRNRLRRMIKEIVRLNGDKVVKGKDLILVVRKPAVEMDYAAMEKSVLHVLKRGDLLIKR